MSSSWIRKSSKKSKKDKEEEKKKKKKEEEKKKKKKEKDRKNGHHYDDDDDDDDEDDFVARKRLSKRRRKDDNDDDEDEDDEVMIFENNSVEDIDESPAVRSARRGRSGSTSRRDAKAALKRKQATALYDSPSSLSPQPPQVIDLTADPPKSARRRSVMVLEDEGDGDGDNKVPSDDDSNSSLTNGVLAMLRRKRTASQQAASQQTATTQPASNVVPAKKKVVDKGAHNLWVDAYRPATVQDLAVHAKKVKQVRDWLTSSLQALKEDAARAPKLLVLTGPSGCGKTATVQMVAQELGCLVAEWINPVVQAFREGERERQYESPMDAFASFVTRSSQYATLFASDADAGKVILVEDAPFVASEKAQVERFRSVLRSFLKHGQFPMVFVVCDAAEGTSNARAILGDLWHSTQVTSLTFNPTNNTLLMKAMRGILAAERRTKAVSEEQLERVALESGGDLRAAVNALQMLCVGAAKSSTGAAPAAASKKKRKAGATQDDFAVPHAVDGDALSSRDSTLSIFHGLGKVFYPKRGAHDGRLIVDPESIVERMPIDLSLMHLFMHENYLTFYTELAECGTALDSLSLADTVLSAARIDGNYHAALETSAGAISIRSFIGSLEHRNSKNVFTPFVRAKARDFDAIRESTKATSRALFEEPCGAASGELRNEALDELLPFYGKMALLRPGEALSQAGAQLRGQLTPSQMQFLYSLCTFNTRLVASRSLERGECEEDDSLNERMRPGAAFEAANAALVGAHYQRVTADPGAVEAADPIMDDDDD